MRVADHITSGSQTNGTTNGVANGADDSASHTVQANFNYTKDVLPKLTELYFYDTLKAEGIHEPGDDPHTMTVHDGWSQKDRFTLDRSGFSVESFTSAYSDSWEDESLVREKFYPEVVDFVKKTLGAKRVLVFDHTIRTQKNVNKKLTQETNTSQRAPVMLVHCDYTSESGPTRVRQLLPEEAEDLLTRRVQFINVWKPLNKVEERPLAMCDAATAAGDDFFKLHLRYRDRDGENYVMKYSDKQRWWYLPEMTPDEVILLKTYESEEKEGMARFVGHTAFEDPETKEGATPRESVEVRTIAFY